MSKTPDILFQQCQGIFAGAGQAIQWVDQVRPTAQRLDRDGDGLIERLRRSRNLARRLGKAATRPMSVGFFGLSQAGKSYLISCLARGENGQLETVLDGQKLDFIDHINPPGGGKEATGLVTRFTRMTAPSAAGYPVRLAMLNEADMIKILGNSYFLDFDRENCEFDLPPERIYETLKDLERRKQPQPTGGITEDDVIDLADYFDRRFKISNSRLAGVFWPTAARLAPYLLEQDRARLFGLLWGDMAAFTATYLRLRQMLAQLGFAEEVLAPLNALVERNEAGEFGQANSIMNVDTVRCRLSRDTTDMLGVLPKLEDGAIGGEVRLPRALLAALTKEMIFTLAEEPRVAMLNEIDLLDFPGYRGRMKLRSVEKAADTEKDADPMGTLFLRGKVAYLFERYTDDQEMNVLLLCNASDKQIEINDLGPILESWVNATQGATPEERARRQPGLLWALTMLDRRLGANLNQSEGNLLSSWGGMIDLNLKERFGSYGWVKDWANGKPFDNLYMMRKPGMAPGLFEMDGERELAILPAAQDIVDTMRSTFLANDKVQEHVANAAQVWDHMIGCDNGGLELLVQHLEKVAILDTKLHRIAEQIAQIQTDLQKVQLGTYYRADGADEVEQKKRIVQMILGEIAPRRRSFAEILRALQPSATHLRDLYLKAEDEAVETPEVTAPVFKPTASVGFDLFAADIAPADPVAAAPSVDSFAPPPCGRAALFAKAVLSDWLKQLRQLPDSQEIRTYLGLSAEALQSLVDEIITGAMRYRMEEKLTDALHKASNRAAATRTRLVDQQVLVATTLVNNFIDWLGFAEMEPSARPASRVPGRTIFRQPQPILPNSLPILDANPLPYSDIFIADWFEAFRATAIGNAGHAAGSEITPEQNSQLGQILKIIGSASLGAAQSNLNRSELGA